MRVKVMYVSPIKALWFEDTAHWLTRVYIKEFPVCYDGEFHSLCKPTDRQIRKWKKLAKSKFNIQHYEEMCESI